MNVFKKLLNFIATIPLGCLVILGCIACYPIIITEFLNRKTEGLGLFWFSLGFFGLVLNVTFLVNLIDRVKII